MAETIPGGWTEFDFKISKKAKKVFDQAFEGFTGAVYSPLAVATQVVQGTNYCFLCTGKVVYPDAQKFAAKVYIFVPLKSDNPNAKPHITEIERVKP